MEKKKRNNIIILIILIILFIIGLVLICYKYVAIKKINIKEEQAIQEYYDNKANLINSKTNIDSDIKYIAILEIPKINLKRGLVSPKDKKNNVRYNIEILKPSSMPDSEKGNLILAAHSGNSHVSFFKNLNKLKLGDEVKLDYNNITYKYKVSNIYDIEKTGKAELILNNDKQNLVLITCRQGTNKQIIVICTKK